MDGGAGTVRDKGLLRMGVSRDRMDVLVLKSEHAEKSCKRLRSEDSNPRRNAIGSHPKIKSQ